MAKIYSNENFPLPVVEFLRSLGHDVCTTRDAGNDGQSIPDEKVLEYAVHTGRILLTLNRIDFLRLHRLNSDHHGMILCTFDGNFKAQAERIDALLRENPKPEGQLLKVNRPNRA
jgi:predicted nuclease of predicted toxin-antitoxin system